MEVPLRSDGIFTSAKYIAFDQTARQIYVDGLIGCTAVAIVSKTGAWLAHIWEDPTMLPIRSDAVFTREAITPLETQVTLNNGQDDPKMAAAWPLGQNGGILDQSQHTVQIFVMTPQKDGVAIYDDRVKEVEKKLTGDGAPWNGVSITRHLYDKPADFDTTGMDEDQMETKRNEILEAYGINAKAKGRMWIEYDPNQDTNPDDAWDLEDLNPAPAMWRVWMEDNKHENKWCPLASQREANNQRRAVACDLPTSEASTGTNTASSTGSTSSTGTNTASSTGSTSSFATTSATPSTTSNMCELEVYGGNYSICSCSSTNSGHTLNHAIVKPSGTDCSDIKTFPMTSFIQVATAVPTSHVCENTQKDLNGNEGAFCQCSRTSSDRTGQAVVTLPYTMGSMVVLDICAEITAWPTNTVGYTPTETQPTVTITGYTSTDIGNQHEYVFTAGKETYDYTQYAAENLPITATVGLGDPIEEIVHGWTSTGDLGTQYAYAEATGDGNGDLEPVGTPTAVIAPEPTENCVKWLYVPSDKSKYGSKYIEYWNIFWGIDGWDSDNPIDDLKEALGDCGVDTSTFSSQENTDKWGSIVMWQNGNLKSDGFYISNCEKNGILGLGGAAPKCQQIGNGPGVPLKDTPEEQMEYINENSNLVKSPYPLDS